MGDFHFMLQLVWWLCIGIVLSTFSEAKDEGCYCFLGDVGRLTSLTSGIPCPNSPPITSIGDPTKYNNIQLALESTEQQVILSNFFP